MLIVLDRDGVINEDSPDFIKSPAEWHAIPGSLEAIAALNKAGHSVVIASNQSGIGRGYFDKEDLKAIHEKMQKELAKVGAHIDAIFYCPHKPEDNCECRKPKQGLYKQIAQKYPQVKEFWVVGDALRDITPALEMGWNAVLVKTGKGKQTLKDSPNLPVPVYENLREWVEFILRPPAI